MNEMYTLSIDIHNFGVGLLALMILINMALLAAAGSIRPYVRRMRILMPLSASMIAIILFTGAVMMAAKRLDFTFENIVMIAFGIVLIVLDAKRYKHLKRCDPEDPAAFAAYKAKAYRLMGIGLAGIAAISAWMFA